MPADTPSIRSRLDRAGIWLAGLCALHCVASIAIVSALGIGGQFLFAPAIHEVGLVLAVIVAAVAIGWGMMRHGRTAPFVIAVIGLALMAGALAVPHGVAEAGLTIAGVVLVALGHVLNLRGHLPHPV